MDNIPTETSPDTTESAPKALFVSFFYKGTDNGMAKEGYDSRVVNLPADVKLASAEDLKAVADAIANTEFANGKRYVGLEITILGLTSLPL